jgi:hypothetical protein
MKSGVPRTPPKLLPVAEGDIAVTRALGDVELEEVMRELHAGGGEGAEVALDLAHHQVQEPLVTRLAERHHVAVAGHRGVRDEIEGPEELAGRGALLHEPPERLALLGGGLFLEVPLEGHRRAAHGGLVDLSLAAAAEERADLAGEPGEFRGEVLTGAEELLHGSLRAIRGQRAGGGPQARRTPGLRVNSVLFRKVT